MILCPCFSSLKQYTTELCLNSVSQNSALHIWCIPSCSYIICTSFYCNFTKFINTTQLSKKDYDQFCYLVRSLNSIKTCSRKSYLTKILFYSLTFFSTNSDKQDDKDLWNGNSILWSIIHVWNVISIARFLH